MSIIAECERSSGVVTRTGNSYETNTHLDSLVRSSQPLTMHPELLNP